MGHYASELDYNYRDTEDFKNRTEEKLKNLLQAVRDFRTWKPDKNFSPADANLEDLIKQMEDRVKVRLYDLRSS